MCRGVCSVKVRYEYCVCNLRVELTQPSTYDFPPHESYKLDFFFCVFKFIRIQSNETYLFVIGKVSKRCWDINTEGTLPTWAYKHHSKLKPCVFCFTFADSNTRSGAYGCTTVGDL